MVSMVQVARFCGINYSRLRNWVNNGLWEWVTPFELNGEWISIDTIKVATASIMLAMRKRRVKSDYAINRIKSAFEVLKDKEETRKRYKRATGEELFSELYLLIVRHPIESRVLIISPKSKGQFQLIDNEDTLCIELGKFLKELQEKLMRQADLEIKEMIGKLVYLPKAV